MTLHRLPAGTDVAEMALFDVDSLPCERRRDGEGIDELVARQRLIRLPTDGDGGYLLHLYVDEPPSAHILRYCLTDDQLSGMFVSHGGHIAFGGIESAFQRFKPNKFIRSDVVIAPGSYAFKAYRTDIPDEVIDKALQRVSSTSAERWRDRAPLVATLGTLGLVLALISLKVYVLAGIVAVTGHLLYKAVKRIPGQDALSVRREEAQMDFPSIVIAMQSELPAKTETVGPIARQFKA